MFGFMQHDVAFKRLVGEFKVVFLSAAQLIFQSTGQLRQKDVIERALMGNPSCGIDLLALVKSKAHQPGW